MNTTNGAKAKLTAKDVIDIIEKDPNLGDARKLRLVRAMKTSCRWFNVPETDLIATPSNLRPRFKRFPRAAHGVSAKRVSNVKSDVKQALRIAGAAMGYAHLAPLSASWVHLRATLADGHPRATLSRFMRYCSWRGIEPDAVTSETFNEFLIWLINEQLVGNPFDVYRRAASQWNSEAQTNPAWPKNHVEVKSGSKAYILGEDVFDGCFIASLDKFLGNGLSTDELDDEGRDRPLKPSSVEAYRDRILRVASAVVLSGHPREKLKSLGELVEIETAKKGFRYLLENRNPKPKKLVSLIAKLLAQISARHITWPTEAAREQNTTALMRISRKLAAEAGLSKKTHERLAPLKHPRNLAALFLLPFAISKPLRKLKKPTHREAVLMSLSLALIILTFCPLRIGALCSLRVDKHLCWSRPNMKGDLTLEFAAGELKNGEPVSLPLPRECAELIRIFLRSFRSRLTRGNTAFLFPSTDPNRQKDKQLMSTQLTRLVRDRLGLDVHPHLYRHVVHLVVLQRFPGAYAMVSHVLTHRAMRTAVENYAGFGVHLSTQAYASLIRDVQSGAAQSKAAAPAVIANALNEEAFNHGKF